MRARPYSLSLSLVECLSCMCTMWFNMVGGCYVVIITPLLRSMYSSGSTNTFRYGGCLRWTCVIIVLGAHLAVSTCCTCHMCWLCVCVYCGDSHTPTAASSHCSYHMCWLYVCVLLCQSIWCFGMLVVHLVLLLLTALIIHVCFMCVYCGASRVPSVVASCTCHMCWLYVK